MRNINLFQLLSIFICKRRYLLKKNRKKHKNQAYISISHCFSLIFILSSCRDLVSHLRADKFLILTSVIDESSQDLATLLPRLPPNQPLALVFGSEERGASQYMRVAADHRFMLPMRGFVESFNLSVSVGLSLQTCRLLDRLVPDLTEVRSNQIESVPLRRSQIAQDEKVEQKARWLMNDTRNAKLVLQRYNIPIPPDF